MAGSKIKDYILKHNLLNKNSFYFLFLFCRNEFYRMNIFEKYPHFPLRLRDRNGLLNIAVLFAFSDLLVDCDYFMF